MAGTLKHLSQNEDQDLRMKRILILAVQPFQVWAETGNVSKLIRWQPSSVRPGVFEEETAWSTQHMVLRLVSKGLCDTCALGYVFSVPAPADCAMCGRGWAGTSSLRGFKEWGTHVHVHRARIHSIQVLLGPRFRDA